MRTKFDIGQRVWYLSGAPLKWQSLVIGNIDVGKDSVVYRPSYRDFGVHEEKLTADFGKVANRIYVDAHREIHRLATAAGIDPTRYYRLHDSSAELVGLTYTPVHT